MILLLTSGVITNIAAQVDTSWVMRYNGIGNGPDKANAIAIDISGNVYITGESYGSGTQYDIATVKYNTNGEKLWARTYAPPGIGWDIAWAIGVDSQSNIYITGYSWNSTHSDYVTIKYNSEGVEQWVRRYDGTLNEHDYAYDLAVDNQGNVLVTGASDAHPTPGISDEGYVTIKYNSEGDTLWINRYDGPVSQDIAYAIAIDEAGNVYVTGESQGPLNSWYDFDYATVKYNSAGDTLWVRRYNGPGNRWDAANAIEVDDKGFVYVTGKSEADSNSVSGYDYTTIKYNPEGVEQWVARYNGTGDADDEANAVALDNQGNIYVTGMSGGVFPTNLDIVTIKYNPAGDTVWVRRFNGPGNGPDVANCIAIDGQGNIYVSGYSYYSSTYKDYLTIKYDSQGNQLWVAHLAGTGGYDDAINSMAVDTNGNVYVTGYNFSSGTDNDYVTIKYVQTGVGVEENNLAIPVNFELNQNYPNPFNPATIISYSLPVNSWVTLKVYNVLGQEVATLVNEKREAGRYNIEFRASSASGGFGLSSGVYFYRLAAWDPSTSSGQSFVQTKKLLLLK